MAWSVSGTYNHTHPHLCLNIEACVEKNAGLKDFKIFCKNIFKLYKKKCAIKKNINILTDNLICVIFIILLILETTYKI